MTRCDNTKIIVYKLVDIRCFRLPYLDVLVLAFDIPEPITFHGTKLLHTKNTSTLKGSFIIFTFGFRKSDGKSLNSEMIPTELKPTQADIAQDITISAGMNKVSGDE